MGSQILAPKTHKMQNYAFYGRDKTARSAPSSLVTGARRMRLNARHRAHRSPATRRPRTRTPGSRRTGPRRGDDRPGRAQHEPRRRRRRRAARRHGAGVGGPPGRESVLRHLPRLPLRTPPRQRASPAPIRTSAAQLEHGHATHHASRTRLPPTRRAPLALLRRPARQRRRRRPRRRPAAARRHDSPRRSSPAAASWLVVAVTG